MQNEHRPLRWRLGLFAALVVTLVALYPQIRLQVSRGGDWNGSYAYFSQDEIAYSAYVNALIEGRPRRNDPYTGRDDAPGAPQHESLFSIQFVPGYALAIPARILRLSAPTTFIILTILVAFASTLTIFRLLALITHDEAFAAAAAVTVVCLGTYAVVYAPLRMLFGLDTTYTFEYFPFLRRYVPAIAFPLFFAFCVFIWRALTKVYDKSSLAPALGAGAIFALLVFSYFYLWTAAAAWLFCLTVLWLSARVAERRSSIKVLAVVAAVAILALAGYAVLLSNRAPTMDSVQLLAYSHAPDFSRSSIKLGLIVCAALAVAAWRRRIRVNAPEVLFAASMALTPLVVFNQQVITGRSLQPLHYELYIAKYLALLALVIAIWLLWPSRPRPRTSRRIALVCVAVIALGWGMVETGVETQRHAWASSDRDEMLPVARRLAELARSSDRSEHNLVVLYYNLDQADISPVIAPQAVLWAPHTPAFSGVNADENRERLYQFLYYTSEDMAHIDEQKVDTFEYRKKYLIHSLIEWGHNDPAWTVDWRKISPEEIRAALDAYSRYAAEFNRERAGAPLLSYVVTDGVADFTNLDRWYQRDAGEQIGRFTLFRVRLRE